MLRVFAKLTWGSNLGHWLLVAIIFGCAAGTATAQIVPTRFDPRRARRVASLSAEPVQEVGFSPDEALLATANRDGQVRLFDTRTWTSRDAIVAGQGRADCLAFAPLRNSRMLAVAGNASLTLWDAAHNQLLYDLPGHDSLVFSVAFSPDGKLLASSAQHVDETKGVTAEIRLWDVATGRARARFLLAGGGVIDSIVFSPDGRWLAGGGRSASDSDLPAGIVVLWQIATGKEWARFTNLPGEIQKVAFSPDGRSLAAASDELVRGAMTVWDIASGRRRYGADGLPCAALDLAHSPDGRLLAVALGDMRWRRMVARGAASADRADWDESTFRSGQVNFYDAHTGEALGVLLHDVPLHRLAISPRGKHLVTAGYDPLQESSPSPTVTVWDLFPFDDGN